MHRWSIRLAVLALVFGLAAFAFLCVWDDASQTTIVATSPGGETRIVDHTSASLIEENGLGVLWWLVVPPLIAAVAVIFARSRDIKATYGLWVTALLAIGYVWLTLPSVGLFFAPVLLSLFIAALLHSLAG